MYNIISHNLNNCVKLNEEMAIEKALALTKGRYQHSLLSGQRAWSGADLRGKAKTYSNSYRDSRHNIMMRIRDSKIPCVIHTVKHNRIVISFGVENISKAICAAKFYESLKDKNSEEHYTAKAVQNLIFAIKNMHDGLFNDFRNYKKNIKKAQAAHMIGVIEK